MNIDWTAVILALIAALSATFAALQGRVNARALQENNRMIATSGPLTLGAQVDQLQADLDENRRRIAAVAQAKLEADAALARAALEAVAKIAAASSPAPPVALKDVARDAAVEVLIQAAETAAAMPPASAPVTDPGGPT